MVLWDLLHNHRDGMFRAVLSESTTYNMKCYQEEHLQGTSAGVKQLIFIILKWTILHNVNFKFYLSTRFSTTCWELRGLQREFSIVTLPLCAQRERLKCEEQQRVDSDGGGSSGLLVRGWQTTQRGRPLHDHTHTLTWQTLTNIQCNLSLISLWCALCSSQH